MNIKNILLIVLMASFLACSSKTEEKQVMRLWYDKPAQEWTEALPIGNGRLGAMIFGGVEQDRIQFNEETLWTGSPREHYRPNAVKYLPEIKKLLAEDRQKEAEDLATAHFMGRKSNEDNYETEKAEWLKNIREVDVFTYAQADLNDKEWEAMELPVQNGWEQAGLDGLDGAVWFRTTFELPATWENKSLNLDLGRIRDLDYTYVNGKLIGSTEGRGNARNYQIPANLLKKGVNSVAVQIINFDDKGGMTGPGKGEGKMAVYLPGTDDEQKIPLSKIWKFKVQDDNPPSFPQFLAAYQPFGDVSLQFNHTGEIIDYYRELDLSTAISRTTYINEGTSYTREYFASEPNQAIVVHIKANQPGKVSFNVEMNSPHTISSNYLVDQQTLGMELKVKHGALAGKSHLKVVAPKGDVKISENVISIENADEATLYLSAGTNYKNYRDITADPEEICRQALRSIEKKTYQEIKDAHVNEYQQYYNTFSLDLGQGKNSDLPTDKRIQVLSEAPDPALIALYVQYGRYLLISSSRPGTRPANLQGIWNDQLRPSWGSKYTSNINVEMNYWPAELLNLSACHEPLFGLIRDVAETGKKTAMQHYGSPGWVLHHNTDLWRGSAPVNASNHGIWVTGGAWLTYHLWERYLFTKDIDFLRDEAYPLMKESAVFFAHLLDKDEKTGWLISPVSNSPENGGLVAGPTMDHQIIRSLFRNVIEASKLLGIDEDLRASLQEKHDQIAPNLIGKYGQLQEWLTDIDDPDNKHRHVSHLWGVHPGNEITIEGTPEMLEAAKKSLIMRGDEGTGWSLAWKINFWARFKDGDHSLDLIKTLLRPAKDGGTKERGGSYANLFDAHPPFQIDGNFGGAAGIVEMLVQSHIGTIELFPALPSELSNGSINGVKARGGFELDFSWKDGEIDHLKVLSVVGEKCSLKYKGKEISFDTEKGKSYVLNNKLELL